MTKRTDGLHRKTYLRRGKGSQISKGPLRNVLYVICTDGTSDAFFSREKVALACGHAVWIYARNQVRARCARCRSASGNPGASDVDADAGTPA